MTTITLISLIGFIVGVLCGSLATYFGIRSGVTIAHKAIEKTVLGIRSGVEITHLTEDREREFALRVTNIEAGAIPIEQENTGEITEQSNTQEQKGTEDVLPDNRSDIFQGVP